MSNLRTAVSTPLRRNSFAPSDFKTPTVRTPSDLQMDIAENNDELERKARQLNRLNRRRSVVSQSPAMSPGDRRRSLNAMAGLTNQQLSEHYEQCIQLSAQNKINAKNAFNLQLIDYMSVMLKRKDSDMNNFQMASCTLDASTKIYAYRVDIIHTDTLKIAGGLGRTKDKPEGETPTADSDMVDVKGKKRKKRGTTIESNMKNLDVASFDLEFDVDPMFKKMASQLDEGQSGGGLFLNSLPVMDDNCQLVLDSETIVGSTKEPGMKEIATVAIPRFSDMSQLEITPTFTSFEFKNWDAERSFIEPFVPEPQNPDLAFDMNAIPEPLDFDNIENNDMEDEGPPLEAAEDDDTVFTVGGGACKSVRPPPRFEIAHLKDHLATSALEYSYFDVKVMSAWAGPGHWKLKPLTKKIDNKLSGKSKDKKKKEFVIDYSESADVESCFAVLRRATQLSTNTVKKWALENTTLPVDLHYEPSKLTRLFLRDKICIQEQRKSVIPEESHDADQQMNQSDSCQDMGEPADMEDEGTFVTDQTNFFSQTMANSQPNPDGADFFGDNLVSAPNKVAKINIGYARTAKKMDMKRLKSTMWNVLTHSNSNKENEQQNANTDTEYKDQMDSQQEICFEDLYKDIQPKLSSKMAENLSVPLAFVALLHLCNEHKLKLASLRELGDFVISQK